MSRKRNRGRRPPSSPAAAPDTKALETGRAPASRRARLAVASLGLTLTCATAGYLASEYLVRRPAAPATHRVVEGDGVRGPRGMVWVQGGEFLMGSDHKLAQPNERPTHRVK